MNTGSNLSLSGVEDEDEFEDGSRSLEVTGSPSIHELIPLLECPVCFELPLPPIRTCLQGHILCAACTPKLKSCPLCQRQIGYGRNFFAEDFINKSTMRCKYALDGCQKVLNGATARAHTIDCRFRPLKCHDCSKKIKYTDYENHLIQEHKISPWDINDCGIRVLKMEKSRRELEHGGGASEMMSGGPEGGSMVPSSLTLFKILFGLFGLNLLTDLLLMDSSQPASLSPLDDFCSFGIKLIYDSYLN